MFSISKYYFDVIDAMGNTVILYAAVLRWMGIKIPFTSYIYFDGKETLESSRLQNTSIQNGNFISFENKDLKIKAHWKNQTQGFGSTLYSHKNKKLIWQCLHPHAIANVRINENIIKGWGYAEVLHLPFLPSKLPIDTLIWGRYLSDQYSIIWIEWKGAYPLKRIYINGELQTDGHISDKGIQFNNRDWELTWSSPQIIKNNPLSSLASQYKILKFLFSKRFLQSHEIKYTSTGVLKEQGKIIDTGLALYETVLWKK